FSALLVLVVTTPPDAALVAAERGAVEPLVHAPDAVHSARIRGIGVVDHAVLEHERAHARSLARVRGGVSSGRRRQLADRSVAALLPRRLAPVVVIDGAVALLFRGERDVEIEVEVAAE